MVLRAFDFYQENVEAAVNRFARPQGNQFETTAAWHVKDHNNSLRGSWDVQMLQSQDTVTKSFAPEEGFEGRVKGF